MKLNQVEKLKPSFDKSSHKLPAKDLEINIKKLNPKQNIMNKFTISQIPKSSYKNSSSNDSNFISNIKHETNSLKIKQKSHKSESKKGIPLGEKEAVKKTNKIQDSNSGNNPGSSSLLRKIVEQENINRNPVGKFISNHIRNNNEKSKINLINNTSGKQLIKTSEFDTIRNDITNSFKLNHQEQINGEPFDLNSKDSKHLKIIEGRKNQMEFVEDKEYKENKSYFLVHNEKDDHQLIPSPLKNESTNIMDSAFKREAQNKLKQQEIMKNEYLSMLENLKRKQPKQKKCTQDHDNYRTGLQIGKLNDEIEKGKEKCEKQSKYKNDLDSQIQQKNFKPENKQEFPDKINERNSLEVASEKLIIQNNFKANSHFEFMPLNNETQEDKITKQVQYKMELDKQISQKNEQNPINKFSRCSKIQKI